MTYDVIVVGAGPAGSIAARECASAGLHTLLIEKEIMPRDKPCGGAVMYRGLRIINNKFPSSLVERKIYGMQFEFPSGRNAKFKSDKLMGITVNRAYFDEYLAHQAVDAGAALMEDTRVKDARISRDNITIKTDEGDELTGSILIGADGVNTTVGRCVGLRPKRKDLSRVGLGMESDFHVGVKGVLQATDDDPSILQILPVPGRAAYGWVFPKEEDLAIGIAGGALHMHPLRPMFESFRQQLEKRLSLELKPTKRRTHFIGGWGIHNKNVTNRVMLIGDAAGWVDPMMGEGIAYAMRSGVISAKIAQDAINLNRYDSTFLEEYHQECVKECSGNFGMAAWAGSRGSDFAESLLVKATRLDIASDLMAMVARGELTYSDIPSRVIRDLPRELPNIIRQIITNHIYTSH